MTIVTTKAARGLAGLAVGAGLVLSAQTAAMAQGLESEGAIETIVGAEVQTDQASADADPERVVAAIENTSATTQEVRRRFNVDDIHIIVLTGVDKEESPVRAAISEHEDLIRDLRIAIEGSAIFYHAVDSNNVALDHVIALEFQDDDVFIFAAPPDARL